MLQKQNIRLRQLIIIGYAVPVLALLGASVVAFWSANRVRETTQEVTRSSNLLDAIHGVNVQTQIMIRTSRGYLLEKNDLSRQVYEEARAAYQDYLARLEQDVRDEQQRRNLTQLRPIASDLMAFNQQLMDLVTQGQGQEAINRWRSSNAGRAKAVAVSEQLAAMEAREQELVEAARDREEEALRKLQNVLIWASGLSLLASGVIGTLVIQRASRQMNAAATLIASSTTQIASSIEEQERSSSHQAASVNQTTTTMDELGASSRQSAEQAEAAASAAQQALALADNGNRAVDRTIQGMATLKTKVSAIAEQILRLSEQTGQIGSISGLVSDIANQTNMLALNAAVEAVRAGEHGKGFSVVATEIRKLADESKKSAERISALVNDIQNAINATVMATDEGTKTVDEGVQIAQETSAAFAGVATAVNNVVLNNQQISLNIKQQAIAIQQVVDAMNSLNIAAQETTGGISQIRIGTQRLNEAAQNLQAII
ncbi:HAMP domain-containing methyl-accepting chemotaxis protein [Trichothermofontia sp.]